MSGLSELSTRCSPVPPPPQRALLSDEEWQALLFPDAEPLPPQRQATDAAQQTCAIPGRPS